MQELQGDYNQLLREMQTRWRGNADFFARHIGISASKASRILAGKQQPSLADLEQMAAIAGLRVTINFTDRD